MSASYQPERYWDEVAENIASRSDVRIIAGDDEPYYRYKRQRFLEVLGSIDFRGKEVLEIGSGPGGNLDFIHGRGANKLTGVDISAQMVELARKNLAGKGVEVIKIDGTALPFSSGSFDVVFSSTVLQHNTDETILKALTAEMARVSRDRILLFERIESRIKGHESNLGRPISYYRSLIEPHGFHLERVRALPIQCSFYACGAIRKVFNPRSRKEGEALTRAALLLQRLVLPLTRVLDRIVPSRRDVMLLDFKRTADRESRIADV